MKTQTQLLLALVLAVATPTAQAQTSYTCENFLSQPEAQAIFRASRQATLDTDRDGIACEHLPPRFVRTDGNRVAMNSINGVQYDVYRSGENFYLTIGGRTTPFSTRNFPSQPSALSYFDQMSF